MAPVTQSSSLSGIISVIVPTGILAIVFLLLFLVLRRSERRQYAPRTYLGSLREQERTPELPKGLFNWWTPFMAIPDTWVLNHQSLDGYLLLRFLKLAAVLSLVGCLITWPVLFPVNATGGAAPASVQQLDVLSFSNVVNTNRYYAHVFISWIFFGFILFLITRELLYFINLRQAYLLSPLYADRISSRTVLFTSVPNAVLTESTLRRMLGTSVQNIWICSDTKELDQLVKDRDKAAFMLEGAETKLIRTANAARLKQIKKGGAEAAPTTNTDVEAEGDSGAIAARYLTEKDRPTHRTKFLVGKKVDTINWCRAELERLIPEVEKLQAVHRAGQGKLLPSVFVEFTTQSEAQAAFQSLTHHQPLHMSPRFIGVNPAEVIWSNLRIQWWERVLRQIGSVSFISALIIFWAIPVAVVGAISNINFLVEKVSFLKFINDIPPVILGVVTNLLPVVALAVLMALLPIILRLAARLGGAPSLSAVELSLQNSYFVFQVVQVFLVATLASAASAVGAQIAADPGSATTILATNLPKASNLYISYFILQGLSISSGAVLQIVGLILSKILGRLLDNTPRKVYKRWASLSGLGWGTIFPPFTLLLVIGIIYAIISPLILGFAAIGFYLIYLAFRYNLLFVFDANIDTKGQVYPTALMQLMTGVYLGEVCLIGLFACAKAAGPLVLEIVFLIFTVLYHISLSAAVGPMLVYLPKSLAAEEAARLAAEGRAAEAAREGEKEGVEGVVGGREALPEAPGKPAPNFFTKFLRPDQHCDYDALRKEVPRDFAEVKYTAEVARAAYYDPAIASSTPLLWIPKDPMGISAQEVAHSSKVIPITDEGATLDEKNTVVTNNDVNPPIYQEKTYY
ncbi:MAG: hypothetical protein M1838_001757 [Thelocarpon superellum]|nr:MAG: hypothetical protein M1838_001757 [Thelocarpon superellum]